MENHVANWGPRPLLAALGWIFAIVSAVLAVLLSLNGDQAGPLLLAVATLAAIAFASYTSFAKPRLRADRTGLRVRTLKGAYSFDWQEVTVELVTTRRLGRDATTVEIDTAPRAPHLIILGRLELDADPADVLEVLNDLRGQA